jgi:hypothetical protein
MIPEEHGRKLQMDCSSSDSFSVITHLGDDVMLSKEAMQIRAKREILDHKTHTITKMKAKSEIEHWMGSVGGT